ncbi:hypothetical protein [Tessaracoccus palaemonis]|uniref:Uncharacterized protein n=1 Tax=Tessaracoccus palaemonis TaxID=2829499 RepID=A0ABX8SHS0_9ACTN|nr:hypothetical protein [Tessaracoccus palaemonis]QXT62215.1 hypothetical protein KDB89_10640 [Tessaracoccus palaemonis]
MRKMRQVVSGLAVILVGLVILGTTTVFSCSEVACGPSFSPSALLFAIAAFVTGGFLLFRR